MHIKTADGIVVDIDREHMQAHASVMPFLKQIIPTLVVDDQVLIKADFDMGEIIGLTDCVETTQYDEIIYAKRPGRPGKTRFVKNRKQQPSSHVTVIMKRVGNRFKLLTSFIGKVAEKELFDKSIRTDEEFMQSKHFWDNHALVWGSQEVES
ncbi:hypothetical protein D3C80_497120 [compost metagenome]